jgi:hypothetical protein
MFNAVFPIFINASHDRSAKTKADFKGFNQSFSSDHDNKTIG